MTDIMNLLTFIPWILYFGFRVLDALKGTKDERINFKWLKKNWKNIFHPEEILLVAIFVYFSSQGNKYLNKFIYQMLFVVMNLYLFINFFYDKRRTTNIELNKKDVSVIIINSIFVIIPIIYYLYSKKLVLTYYRLFMISFFSYPLVLITRLLDFSVRKLIKRK